jgi:hypothetical protein
MSMPMSMPWNVIKVTLHSSSHYPSDAMSMPMSMPWNVIKVTLHSSSYYPRDAMSMPWNVVKVTLPTECNVHAMECGQGGNIPGDITHVRQCPFEKEF